MTQITKPIAYRVDIIESERGWGSKVDETLYFDSEDEARKYVSDYNTKYNTSKEVPDWYMVAEYCGKVCVMNEHIRELIDQATIRGVEYLAGNDGHPTPTIYFDKEKFAELIINECVSVVKEHYDDTLPWGGVEIVLEHFGVEE